MKDENRLCLLLNIKFLAHRHFKSYMPLLHTKERFLSTIVAKVTQIRIHFPDTFPFFHLLKRTGICYDVKVFISYYLSILSKKVKV